jgi:hypothetical protein
MIASVVMVAFYLFTRSIFWPVQAVLGVILYFLTLYLVGEQEMRGLLEIRRV